MESSVLKPVVMHHKKIEFKEPVRLVENNLKQNLDKLRKVTRNFVKLDVTSLQKK